MHPSSIDDKEWIDEGIAAQTFDTSQQPLLRNLNSESPASVAFPFYCDQTVKGLIQDRRGSSAIGIYQIIAFYVL